MATAKAIGVDEYSNNRIESSEVKEHKTFATSASVENQEDAVPAYRRESAFSAIEGGKEAGDNTHRTLKARHIQLMGIGGTIGTVLFVQIGQGLLDAGPGSLFIAFTFWCSVILAITVSVAEMVTYLPISSPFVRFADRYVDPAFGFAAGWNYFALEAALVPFELVACNFIINFWSDVVPVAAIITIQLTLYAFLNVIAVKWYGESEFWSAIGKVLLAVGLIFYTFITMLGGNPEHDRFGFRYWKSPGAFAELYYTGSLGKWVGFLSALILASFSIAGPDYVSMAAGEASNPRKVMPKAYRAVFYRLTVFFSLGALCIGINVPYNDPTLIAAFKYDAPGAAASPYVIAMTRLRIKVLPDIVNAAVLLSAFSAGNSYVYCASRTLFGLALEGKAPKILTKCTKQGVPVYCVIVVFLISLIAFLQTSNGASVVLNWIINLVTASQLINFSVMTLTFMRWKKACDAQGLDRNKLPFTSWGQPYVAMYGFGWCFVMTFVSGYPVFLPGHWSVTSFLFSYMMIFVFPVLYIGWKFYHKTSIRKPGEIDLTTGVAEVDEYTANYVEPPPRNKFEKYIERTAKTLHIW